MTAQSPPEVPERVRLGLLPYLSAHALDEDYQEAAARRGTDDGPAGLRRVGAWGAVALATLAALAVVAGAQTSRNSVSAEGQRRDLVAQVKDRAEALDEARQRQDELRASNRQLESSLLRDSEVLTDVEAQGDLLALRSGTVPVSGPGVEVIADDAPDAETERNRVLDTDLQQLVNGLWAAGAEAISINGERLTALSAIRHAGSGITVNFTSLSRPYRIRVIGDPATLPSRFADTASGRAWLDLQRQVGLRLTMRTATSLRLPGSGLPSLRFANREPQVIPREGS